MAEVPKRRIALHGGLCDAVESARTAFMEAEAAVTRWELNAMQWLWKGPQLSDGVLFSKTNPLNLAIGME